LVSALLTLVEENSVSRDLPTNQLDAGVKICLA
jgi:hypothetical protein